MRGSSTNKFKQLWVYIAANANGDIFQKVKYNVKLYGCRSERWGGSPKGNCFNETKMLEDQTFFAARTSLLHIINEELSKSAVPVTFLNITLLTSPRKDAHNSIYKEFYGGPLTKDQKANGTRYADCIHWCLPGVQDVWNELFFAKLFFFP